MQRKGLDVSEFQGNVDWEKVKAAGYQFAMLRAGYGFGTIDPQFKRNASECNRIGLSIGIYWFCYALNPEIAIQEADGCLKAISDYRIDYPVCYDIEQASVNYAAQNGVTFTPETARNIVQNFCNRIEQKGYFAMYYSNRNFLQSYQLLPLSSRYALWYAFYNSKLDNTECQMWQFTSQGNINGISGDVDLDYVFVDYPSIIKNAGLNHLSSKPVAPQYISYTIKYGDTLSEIAARFQTTVPILQSLNHISDPNLIYAGHTIRIPKL